MRLVPKNLETGRLRTLEIKKNVVLFRQNNVKCYCVHGGHGGERRRAARVMRGPRICGVASAQGRITGRVRSSRSQRGERWEPSRRG